MSFREGARAVGQGAGAIIAIIVIIAVFAAVIFGLWAFFAPKAADVQRETNRNSQQYQDAQIAEAESLIDGILKSNDEGQTEVLTARFCTTYDRIIDPPIDLVVAAGKYC